MSLRLFLSRVPPSQQLPSKLLPQLSLRRAQSSSSDSRPPHPAVQQSFEALASDLLATPSTLSSSGLKRSAPEAPRTFIKSPSLPPVQLSRNPYAGQYAISEDDLDDPFETEIAVEEPKGLAVPPRRRRLAGRQSSATARPQRIINLSPHDTVSVYPDFISLTSHGRTGVITNARLLDACHCKKCRDPSTRQMNTTTGEAVRESKIARITRGNSVRKGGIRKDGLVVSWGEGVKHMSFFPLHRLRSMLERDMGTVYRSPSFVHQTWDGESLSLTNLRFQYSDLSESLLKVLEQLQVYGIVVIEGVPTDPTDDKECMLRKVTDMIGKIRNTFYGETWDVKSVKQSKNIAYTNLNLGLHMDLLYFSSPPRFQALHCLRNKVEGGSSYFVDSFRTVSDLPRDQFEFLQKINITYQYDNDNHYFRYRHPIISSDFVRGRNNRHAAVNWSPPFRAAAEALDFPQHDFVAAAKHEQKVLQAIADFEERLSDPRYRYEFTMQEGDLVLFDNRRVLHARTAFRDKKDMEVEEEERVEQKSEMESDKEPTRWLKGCYLDGEAVWDKLATLRKQSLERRAASVGVQ